MKRLYSIVFLILFLLNISGYYAFLMIAKQQITQDVASKIAQNANEINGNMILKFPMRLPYPAGSDNYEEISVEAEFDGELYHVVKQRFYQDTLYVVCIKDYQTKKIREAIDDCIQTFTDVPAQSSSSSAKVISSLVKEFLLSRCSLQAGQKGWDLSIYFGDFKDHYLLTRSSAIFHPPQLA